MSPSIAQRATTWFVGVTLLFPSTVVHAHSARTNTQIAGEPNVRSASADAEEYNAQAQRLHDQGDRFGAARMWRRAHETLPENRVNREERETTLLVSLASYREAFHERRRIEPRDQTTVETVNILREAVRFYDAYEHDYQVAYPGGLVSDVARDAGNETKALLAEAEALLAPLEPPPPQPPEMPFRPTSAPRKGTGLIIGGSVAIAAGLSTTAMIAVGARKASNARDDRDDATTDEARQDAEDRVRRANALTITGSVLSGVLVAGGATMLGLGIRRRLRYYAFSPTLSPQFVGLQVGGRF